MSSFQIVGNHNAQSPKMAPEQQRLLLVLLHFIGHMSGADISDQLI